MTSSISLVPVAIGLLPCQETERWTQDFDCVFGGVVVFSVHACGGRRASSLASKPEAALVRGRQASGRRCPQSMSEARTRRRRPEAERDARSRQHDYEESTRLPQPDKNTRRCRADRCTRDHASDPQKQNARSRCEEMVSLRDQRFCCYVSIPSQKHVSKSYLF